MRTLTLYQVDAFTDKLFSGNPAAVCVLEDWLKDELMQSIALENNLSETVFVVPKDGQYQIRWFTPLSEVKLCGHATLASAYVLYEELGYSENTIAFYSPQSGALPVTKADDRYYLNFPAQVTNVISEEPVKSTVAKGIGVKAQEIYKGDTDYLVVLENEEAVRSVKPDFGELLQLEARGLIITAPGTEVDFVSRFFGPKVGVNEDPVTGSAHTLLIPYWAKKLSKNKLNARQLSSRGGQLWCEYKEDRVIIGGQAKLFMKGEIHIEY